MSTISAQQKMESGVEKILLPVLTENGTQWELMYFDVLAQTVQVSICIHAISTWYFSLAVVHPSLALCPDHKFFWNKTCSSYAKVPHPSTSPFSPHVPPLSQWVAHFHDSPNGLHTSTLLCLSCIYNWSNKPEATHTQ